MGTPHQGANGVQLGKLLVNVASMFVAADDRLMKHLERDSEWLQQQLGQYGPISSEFITKFAFEVYPTPTVVGHSVMVCPLISSIRCNAADSAGCTQIISRCPGRGRRRADCHPRRPRQHGQVRIEVKQWLQDGVGTFADHGPNC